MGAVEEKLQIMRAVAIKKAPYWATLIRSFAYTPVPGYPTVGLTEGGVFFYGPEYVRKQNIDALAADVAHEALHWLHRHFARAGRLPAKDRFTWNLAGDMAINPALVKAGWKLSPDSVFPKDYGFKDALTVEQYFSLLQKQGKGKRSVKGTQGSPEDSPAGHGQEQEQEKGRCCGGAAGNPHNTELERKLDAECGRDEVEQRAILSIVAADIAGYVKNHGRGTVPGFLEEWAQALSGPPVIQWQDRLSALLHAYDGRIRGGQADYSLRRPSKSSLLRGIPRPGLVDYEPTFAFILDTSGSMDQNALVASMRECAGILTSMSVEEAWFAQVDTRVVSPFAMVPLQHFEGRVSFRGRGGTDFRPGFEAAINLRPKPDVIVYFTDGDGPAPAAPPDTAVVWCLIGAYVSDPAPWGEKVRVT